uniref:Dicer-like protein 1 n=1 Tax=Compsopogon caeruleus TaxID=31354 RepID=A0A7S1XF89_9RHOD
MVVVSTPQVLLDAMRHGMIDLRDVHMMIFDEAHHATGGHPYNSIMHEFFFETPLNDRPKIFGMTASPVKRRNHLQKERAKIQFSRWIEDLETNLNARLVCSSDCMQEEIASSAPSPTEYVVEYTVDPEVEDFLLMESRRFEELEAEADSDRIDDLNLQAVSAELGEFCLHLCRRRKEGTLEDDIDDMEVTIEKLSHKVQVLLMLLLQEFGDVTDHSKKRAVVFVRRRIFAWSLAQLFASFNEKMSSKPFAAGFVVGESYLMSLAKQRETVRDFRNGRLNLIIATDVIEEGLDIPACNMVVMFNDVITARSYIQSSGRARHTASKYIVMMPTGRLKDKALDFLASAKCGSSIMHTIARRSSRGKPKDIPPKNEFEEEESLRSKTTSARIPRDACTSLLNRYCEALPGDEYSEFWKKPKYFESFSEPFYVQLPPQCGILNKIRAKRTAQNKSLGRALASLAALQVLYERGELDEHLFPVNEKHQFEKEMEGFAETITTRGPTSMEDVEVCPPPALRWCPELCGHAECDSGSGIGYLYWIHDTSDDFKELQSGPWEIQEYCVVTSIPITESQLVVYSLPSGKPYYHLLARGSACLSPTMVLKARKYASFARSIAINDWSYMEGPGAANSGYLFLPFLQEGKIDWASVDLAERFLTDGPMEYGEGDKQFKVGRANVGRHKATEFVYTGKLDLSWEVGDRSKNYGKCESIATYYERKFKLESNNHGDHALRFWRFCPIDDKMRIRQDQRQPKVCPEHVEIFPLPPVVVRFAKKLPHLERQLSVAYLQKNLNLPFLDSLVTLARSITPKASRDNDYNYERLEYLGDTVLKIEASRVVYHAFPTVHEGVLTNERSKTVCNEYLAKVGIGAGFVPSIASTKAPTSLKGWPWPFADYSVSSIRESGKVIADCLESVVGLCYVKAGLDGARQFMKNLNILDPLLLERKSKPILRDKDPRTNSPKVREVEKILDYTFRDKELLVEALTHPSWSSTKTRTLGRLEFLGDSVVGLVVTEYLFNRYETLPPAALNSLRDPMVSNDFFGRIVLSLNLCDYLWQESKLLCDDIEEIRSRLARANTLEDDDIWNQLKLPKSLADIFESLMGAIYVDLDCDYLSAKKYILPLLEGGLKEYAEPSKTLRHPVADLNIIIQQICNLTPTYVFRYEKASSRTLSRSDKLTKPAVICTVMVRGKELGEAKQANKKMAKKQAARKVLEEYNLTTEGPSEKLRRMIANDETPYSTREQSDQFLDDEDDDIEGTYWDEKRAGQNPCSRDNSNSTTNECEHAETNPTPVSASHEADTAKCP